MGICSQKLLFAMVLMLGSLSFGYTLVYPAPAIPDMRKKWTITQGNETLFRSISALTAIFGPFLSNFILRFFGRKMTTFTIALIGLVFWAIVPITSEKHFVIGIIIRAFNGIDMGALSHIIPMYIVEMAPREYAAFFGSLNQLGVSVGIVFCYLIGNWFNWIITAIVGACICLALCGLIWLVPESPAQESYSTLSTSESLWQKKYVGNLVIGLSLMLFQQFSGVNAILTNLNDMFSAAKVTISPGIASAISSSAQVVAVLIGGLLMDHVGRKAMWIISSMGLSVSLAIYTCTLAFTSWPKWIPIAAVFLFMLFFGCGSGPIPWFIVPELFPSSVRSMATTVTSCFNWVCAFSVIFVFPSMVKGIGSMWSMVIFTVICFCSALFGIKYVQDPKKNVGEFLEFK